MATLGQIKRAIVNAQRAGDEEAVRVLNEELERGRAQMRAEERGAGGSVAGAEPASPSRQRGRREGGSGFDTAYQGLTFGYGDEISGAMAGGLAKLQGKDFTPAYENTRDYVRGRVDDVREKSPVTAFASEVAGGLPMIMFGGPFASLRNAVMGGAAYGFGSGEEDLANRLKTAGGGALGGGLGHMVFGGLKAGARALFPKPTPRSRQSAFREQINLLRRNNIDVTPAEEIASPNARMAERMTGAYFGQGDNVAARPTQLYRQLMRMSNFAPRDIQAGELSMDAVQRAGQRFQSEYNRLLTPVSVGTGAFRPFIQRIRAGYDQLLPFEQRANVNRVIGDFENVIFRNQTLTGREYQRLRSNLAKQAFQAQKSEANRYLAPVYRSLRYTLDSAFLRGAPRHTSTAVRNLNRQYSGYKVLQKAVDNPDAIGTMANEARRNRGRLNREFHDLATAYQDVLLRGYPQSSGTAENYLGNSIIPPIVPMFRALGTRMGSAPSARASNAIRGATGVPPDMNLEFPPVGSLAAAQQAALAAELGEEAGLGLGYEDSRR